MKLRALVVALILSVGINIGILAGSLYRRWTERLAAGSGCVIERSYLNRRLNLTREQLAVVAAMRDSMYQRTAPLRSELCARRMDLLQYMQESDPDSVRLDSLTREIASLQARLESQVVRNARQIGATLKPEQQKLLLGIFESHLCGQNAHAGPLDNRMNRNPPCK